MSGALLSTHGGLYVPAPVAGLGTDTIAAIDRFAATLMADIWKHESTRSEDIPLPVAMLNTPADADDNAGDEKWYDSGHRLLALVDRDVSASAREWRETERRLGILMQNAPENDENKLMYAAHLHSKYVLLGPKLFASGQDTCREDEKEIERLVLGSLAFAQTRPDYAVIAAKLLYFLKSGYDSLAVDMAESAHEKSARVATSSAVVGQTRCFRGQFAGARECLLQAQNLAEHGSRFHIYVLVLHCQMLLAANDREGLEQVRRELYTARPASGLFLEPLMTDPAKPSIRAKGIIMMLSCTRAKALLHSFFYISGRLFENTEHRENMMRTLVILLRQRFGDRVLSDAMRTAMPDLTA